MRVNKNKDEIYTKELDNMESYFLNILKRFFETDNEELWINRESIIIEAVRRAKEDFIKYPNHFSVTNVNGMSGNVILTPGNIDAEPAILVKKSAFNKSFGDSAYTVCEGNDPRLSDSRDPLPHKHDDEYIKKDKIDSYIREYLLARNIIITDEKIIIENKDLQLHNGELKEL